MLCHFDNETLRCTRCGFIAKSLPHYRNCQTIEEMARAHLDAWAHGRIKIPPARLGSWIASGLSTIGVTEERVKKLIGDCGCAARKNKLDAIGEGITTAIQTATNRALDAVLPHPVTEADVAALAQSIANSPILNQGLRDKAAGR
jgi:hypothetical protein